LSTTFFPRERLKVSPGGWGPTRDGNSPEAAFGQARVKLSPETVEAIAADLRRSIEGEVRFDAGSCALYATDASNYRQVPYGVVVPKSVDDVIATMAVARAYGAPILSRGGGTSLAGQCCNVAVVIDWTKYLHHVLDIDPTRKLGRVEPGCILDHLRDEAGRYDLTFGPDPATHTHNTLGGMIGNDSCGVHSVMAVKEGRGARTADNVESLEVLTYDGTRMSVGSTSEEELERIIRQGGRKGEIYAKMKDLRDRYADEIRRCYPDIPRRVSGYNLDSLLPENGFNVARALVGSEGTLVAVLNATLNLVHNPKARALLVLGYPDVYSAGDHVPEAMGYHPIACEGLDDRLVRDMIAAHIHPGDEDLLPPGKG
jgi:FAD/FMN-containing dehydrogenase